MITDEAVVEGYAVETLDGLIFTVKGLVHPADRLIAYLRYLPHPRGDRKQGNRSYRRVYQFEEQRKILQHRFPAYIYHDPFFGIELQSVPWQDVRQIYDPCKKLAMMRDCGPTDPLKQRALALADLLKNAADVPMKSLGISGSVLVGLHGIGSDLDLVIYGEQEGHAVHEALQRLLADPGAPVGKLEGARLTALHAKHQTDTPIPYEVFASLQSRKVNEGCFEETPYFIRFIKRTEEIRERYGDPYFEPLGMATIECRVRDHRDAIFTPCRYRIEDVHFLDCRPENDVQVQEVISFRGRFSDQVWAGERMVAKGRLERVISISGEVHHRLNVGGQAGDYLSIAPTGGEVACKY